MIIMNTIGYNRLNFQGIQKMPNTKKVDSETLRSYVQKAIGYFRKDGDNLVPENGKFAPLAAYLEVKGRPDTARLAVEYDPLDPKTQRLVNIGVYRNGTDKIYQRYPVSGTKKEVLDYLKSEKAENEIYNHIIELSNKVDNQ